MNKTTRIRIFSVIIIVLMVTGCHNTLQKKAEDSAEVANIEPDKVTVLLDWFPNTNHTGLYIANERGYFDEEGLDVEIIQPGEGSNAQIVASGGAEFAVSSQEAVTQARAVGIPVVSIAAVLQHNTSAFAALKESGIEKVEDFEGKRYGGWGSPIEEAVLTAVMGDVGADFANVENVTIGTTDFFTSIGRENDFQWIFYAWDGIEAKRRGIELNLIWVKDLGGELDYYTPVIIASEDVVQGRQDLARRFLEATTRGYEFAIEDPEAAAEILIDAVPEINADLVRESQAWISKEYQSDASQWGDQKEDVWRGYAEFLNERGLIEEMIDVEQAFTSELLPVR